MRSNGATVSLWTDTAQVPSFAALDSDTSADVCVVGGGIAGLTSAYLLLREGRSVVLVEALHMGCAVHWNTAEKSWDCPCHGSRFDVAGQVLHGPSNAPLAAAGPKAD